jgi:hypothetical protein
MTFRWGYLLAHILTELNLSTYPAAHGGLSRGPSTAAIMRPPKDTMSTKIDCVIYLKSKLESEFTKLTTGETPNLPAAQKVQSIADSRKYF